MRHPVACIHANVALHGKAPPVAFLALVHLRAALAAGILGGAWRSYQRGVDRRSLAQQQIPVCEDGIDQGQNLQS